MNIKQFEYGVIGILLANQPDFYDVTGTLTDEITEGENVSQITLTLATPPVGIKSGMWLTGNAGNYQRFEYNGFTDNTDGTYTFNISSEPSRISRVGILAGTAAFVELKDLPIFEYGDLVESEDFDFIQVKAEKPEQEFPNIKGDASNYWKLTTMVAVVNRTAQDKDRSDLSEVYDQVERAFVKNMDIAELTTYSGVTILGYLQQENEDGKWDNERQGLIAEMEIKFEYSDEESAPVFTTSPSITGVYEVGEILTVTEGIVSGNPYPAYTYQWRRNNIDIIGETGKLYNVETLDSEQNITCVVTATNSQGSAVDVSNIAKIAFIPLSLDLVSWYDLSDTDSVDQIFGRISNINDKSTNSRDFLQPNQPDQPYYDGKQASFYGDSTMSGDGFDGIGLSDIMVYFVVRPNIADYEIVLSQNSFTDFEYRISNTNTLQVSQGGNFFSGDTVLPIDEPCVTGWTRIGTSIDLFQCGVIKSGTQTQHTFPDDPLTLGERASGGFPMYGGVYEIIISKDATLANRQKIEGYLSWKWDEVLNSTKLVDGLPSDHPYKNFAP
jgi:hypothetical protein